MHTHLHKIDHRQNQHRWYAMEIARDLLGDYLLVQEWGRIGNKGGQRRLRSFTSHDDSLIAFDQLKRQKERKGYIPQPEQIDLPLFAAE